MHVVLKFREMRRRETI